MSAVQPKGVDRERPSSRETGAIAAGFVQGLSGFGFGLVAMSFWAWSRGWPLRWRYSAR